MEIQLNRQLKVARMEIDGLKKCVDQESGFSEKQSVEITRLGGEISSLNSEKDMLTKELQDLKSAPPPAASFPATYPPPVGAGVPPGPPYGSLISSQVQMLGHFSPNIPPYRMSATQAAYAGPGGQAQSYGSPQHPPPPPAHQYQGSPQAQQVAINLFQPPVGLRPESPLAQGSNGLSQAVVFTLVTTLAPST